MKICIHITYFYTENTQYRIEYLNNIILESNSYGYFIDIFIHTNVERFGKELSINTSGGNTHLIYHNIENEDPLYLSRKCRPLLKSQKDFYDIFIYLEDDILIPKAALNYWLINKDLCIQNNYNLGFFRIEVDQGIEYCSDNSNTFDGSRDERLHKIIQLNSCQFVINDKNPYCAFWIYDRSEFNRFINHQVYDYPFLYGPDIREGSAIGFNKNGYKGTIIPLINGTLHPSSKVYHLDNKFFKCINQDYKLNKFNEVLKKI
jgi:hypothetical protein